MSALIKLPSASGTGTYLGIPSSGKGLFKFTKDGMGLRSHAVVATSDEEGLRSLELKLNQTVKLSPPVVLRPKRYTVMIGFNPKLAEFGQVSNPVFFNEGDEIFMMFKANKNVNLNDLEYIFVYYMID